MSMSRAGLDEKGRGWHAVSSRTFRLGLLACSGYYVVRGERGAPGHSFRQKRIEFAANFENEKGKEFISSITCS